MFTVLLIASALIVGYVARPKDKQSYHMAVMAIFGVAYFCIWRFADFYLNEFTPGAMSKHIAFLVLMSVAVILCLLPWVRNITRLYAIVLAVIFGISAVVTFLMEKDIQNLVAGWGGYFGDQLMNVSKVNPIAASSVFDHKAGGFSIRVPDSWGRKQNESGLTYFDLEQNKKILAELRPRCFHDTKLSVVDIINNILEWDRSQGMRDQKYCNDKEGFVCFVQSIRTDSGRIREKWRWLVMDEQQRQNIELDFVFYDMQEKSRNDAKAIINSIKLHHLPDPLPQCVSTIDWF